jgi:TetR/AcrR family transcriptional regulator, transcriptional repressor for nem operon
MSPRRAVIESDVVRAAREIFWRQGYSNTSMADLEMATGLGRSRIHSVYGGKRKLFSRALEDYLDDVAHPMLLPLEAEGAGRAELADHFLGLARIIRRLAVCDVSPGCMVLNTVMELFVLGEEASEAVRGYQQRTRQAFLHALRSDSVAGPDARADLLVLAQIGVIVSSKLDAEDAAQQAELEAAQIKSW